MKICRRINVYLNRHVFAKVCFVIDEEIVPQWVVGVGGVLLNEMDHITVDPIEKSNLIHPLFFMKDRIEIYYKQKLGIIKKY